MTIEKLEPGLWYATCDCCGEQIELDTDPDDEFVEAVAEIKGKGWKILPPETVKFATDLGSKRHKVTYWEHRCPDSDCQSRK